MTLTKLNDDFAVSAQIYAHDIDHLVKKGFRSIICNRPDGETPDQPDFATIASIAKRAGLESSYVPVRPGDMQKEHAIQFSAVLRTLPGPTLAYCRSGARSTALWKMQNQLAENTTN